MGKVLEILSTEALGRAIEENQREFFIAFFQNWPGAVVYDQHGLTRVRSSGLYPLFNPVLNVKEGLGDADARIQAIQAEHASHGVPLGWMVWPTTHPDINSDRLIRNGFVHATDLVGMAVDLHEMPPAPVPEGVTITEVRDAEEFAEWMEPCRIAFELPDRDAEGFHQGLLGMGFGGDSPVHHYIARLDGKPVACSSLYLGCGVAGIYDVATLPEARGLGIGAAVTQLPLLAARELGYRAGILQATPMADPVYRRIGFREIYRIPFYAWGMSGH